jgi:hypothetical protein
MGNTSSRFNKNSSHCNSHSIKEKKKVKFGFHSEPIRYSVGGLKFSLDARGKFVECDELSLKNSLENLERLKLDQRRHSQKQESRRNCKKF